MTSGNIKYIAVCRSSDAVIVASYLSTNKSYMNEFLEVIAKVMKSDVAKAPRKAITVKGTFICHFAKQNDWHAFVMTAPTYKSTYVWELLENFKQQFAPVLGSQVSTAKPNGLSKQAQQIMQNLVKMYDNPEQIDKLQSVQKLADETMGVVTNNMVRMMDMNNNLTVVDGMAEGLLDDATEFNVKTKEVKKAAKGNKRRTRLIMIGVAVGIVVLVLVIVLPIVCK